MEGDLGVREAAVGARPDDSRVYARLKRLLDVVLSLGLMAITAPLWIVIALSIKLESRGPIFFSQVRVGRGGHLFRMYKFRSMRQDAETLLSDLTAKNEAAGPIFKISGDPRKTRVGSIIRHLSLDELPQLVNVLQGTMSVVGPRPPLPQEVDKYDNWHLRRLLAAPGITGLWQVSRGSSASFDEMVRLDLEYIEKQSLRMDLSILIRTIPAVLSGRGAY